MKLLLNIITMASIYASIVTATTTASSRPLKKTLASSMAFVTTSRKTSSIITTKRMATTTSTTKTILSNNNNYYNLYHQRGTLFGEPNDRSGQIMTRLYMTSSSSSTTEEGSRNDNTKSEEEEDNHVDFLEKYQNKNNIDDQIFSAISENGEIKVTACTIRNLVNDFMIMHTLNTIPGDALGRTAICTLLCSNGMQDEQTFQITVNSNGPIRGIVCISNGIGEIRGYVGMPQLGGTSSSSPEMSLQSAIGTGGFIQVVKNHPDWPNPYNGVTAIRHCDIDRDVGAYLAESEQRSCALAASTSFNGILCTAAGGYLVEQLPGITDETINIVEKNLKTLLDEASKGGSSDGTTSNNNNENIPTSLLLQGKTPVDICSIILDGLDMQPLQQIKPKHKCKCSEERLFRALRLLDKSDVEDILAKEEQIEARCEFCGKIYRMSPTEVEKRYKEAKGDPSKDEDNKDLL